MKPMTLAREEMISAIYAIINNSGLPAFVIEDALRRILADAEIAAQQQYAADMQNYRPEEEPEEEKAEG